jgi:hypothetical protein
MLRRSCWGSQWTGGGPGIRGLNLSGAKSLGGMVNVVLAVGEGFACEGVFGMIEHRFKRLFNLLP